MKKVLVLVCVVAMTTLLSAQSGKANGDVGKSIEQMEKQWATDSKAGKVDSIASMLNDKFVELDSDGKMYTRTQVLDRIKNAKWDSNEVSDVKVTTHGDTAIAAGEWRGKGTSGGKAVDAHERWVDTWMKGSGGQWQCIASASAPTK